MMMMVSELNQSCHAIRRNMYSVAVVKLVAGIMLVA